MTEVPPDPDPLRGPSFKSNLIAHLPQLRAFARSLCIHSSDADDLLQEVLVKAWANRSQFQSGSNLRAWLFTITRNAFYDRLRKSRQEALVDRFVDPDSISGPNEQFERVAFNELKQALGVLPAEFREAIILVGASGFSYEEAAQIAGVPVGTIKSRVSRARELLVRHLA